MIKRTPDDLQTKIALAAAAFMRRLKRKRNPRTPTMKTKMGRRDRSASSHATRRSTANRCCSRCRFVAGRTMPAMVTPRNTSNEISRSLGVELFEGDLDMLYLSQSQGPTSNYICVICVISADSFISAHEQSIHRIHDYVRRTLDFELSLFPAAVPGQTPCGSGRVDSEL